MKIKNTAGFYGNSVENIPKQFLVLIFQVLPFLGLAFLFLVFQQLRILQRRQSATVINLLENYSNRKLKTERHNLPEFQVWWGFRFGLPPLGLAKSANQCLLLLSEHRPDTYHGKFVDPGGIIQSVVFGKGDSFFRHE